MNALDQIELTNKVNDQIAQLESEKEEWLDAWFSYDDAEDNVMTQEQISTKIESIDLQIAELNDMPDQHN